MKRHLTSRPLTIALVGLVAGLTSAGVTFAGTAAADAPTADLTTAKAACLHAVDTRLADLGRMAKRATNAPQLTDAHEATISAIVTSAKSGLTALRVEIDADTDLASLKTDCDAVAADYRVYALRAPQVYMAIGGDRAAAGVTKGNEIVTKLQTAIGKAEDDGQDVTHVNELLADMQSKLATASSAISGVVDTELTYTPADWNANHGVLNSTGNALKTAHTALKAALDDAKAIVAELKA